MHADYFSPDAFGQRLLELRSVRPWSEIERLTYPAGKRLLYLVRVNNLEQVAILYFLGRTLHEYEPFDFARKEDPYFEKSLPGPHKEIADLL